MGVSIELKKGNFDELVDKLMSKYEEIESKSFLVKVLETFGEHIGEYYLLLNNEYWEEFNSYYSVSSFIDRYYGVQDSFEIFLYNMKEANANWHENDVAEELGVELPELKNRQKMNFM